MQPLRIFIGYDSREPAAFAVLSHSILRHASRPVAIIPLVRDVLAATLATTFGTEGATEFTRTRFLVPYLSGYEGRSIFMDCDMLARADIMALFDLVAYHDEARIAAGIPEAALNVVQHLYTPKATTKMDGQVQTAYPRKNWSSLMVFNNEHPYCRALTPSLVSQATLSVLHRFQWVIYDDAIGDLSTEWNWLVGEYLKNPNAKILHFTNGGPWFRGYEACDHADDWFAERELMLTGKAFEPHLRRSPCSPWPANVESA